MPVRNLSAHRQRNPEGGESRDGSGRERSGAMSEKTPVHLALEPERYELAAAAPYHFDLDRREFFKFLGAGVLVVSILKPGTIAQESGAANRRRDLPKDIDAWLHISTDNTVTV